MDLLLWRHAEAEEGIPDLKRRLTPRGEKQARQIAAWLKENGPADLRIIVSPATRCQQTANTLGLPFETNRQLDIEGDVTALLAAADWPDGDKAGAVLVVGHQPTLGQTAALLLSGAEANWTFKKGALWWFRVRERFGVQETVLRAVIPAELT